MSDDLCVLCYNKNNKIYAVGDCNHPICYVCSTRMRILSKNNECPICRRNMVMVIFTEKIRPYKELKKTYVVCDHDYKIGFTLRDIQIEYNNLFDLICKKCNILFQNEDEIAAHMKKNHDLYLCKICDESLMLFPYEKRWYTRSNLSRHKRYGDPDDSSYRGHSLCRFCEKYFLDKDDLYRHLRMAHYFCHLCEGEGIQRFYGGLDELKVHFKANHYLCEDGECNKEPFPSVYATEEDLRAHRSLAHYQSKQGGKYMRIEVQFNVAPRISQSNANNENVIQGQNSGNEAMHLQSTYTSNPPSWSESLPSLEAAFPVLGNLSSAPINRPIFIRSSSNRLARTNENFPALGSESDLIPRVPEREFTARSPASNHGSLSVQTSRLSVPINRCPSSKKRVTNSLHINPCPAQTSSAASSSSESSTRWVAKAKSKSESTNNAQTTQKQSTTKPKLPKDDFPSLNTLKNTKSVASSSDNSKNAQPVKKSSVTLQMNGISNQNNNNNNNSKNNSKNKGVTFNNTSNSNKNNNGNINNNNNKNSHTVSDSNNNKNNNSNNTITNNSKNNNNKNCDNKVISNKNTKVDGNNPVISNQLHCSSTRGKDEYKNVNNEENGLVRSTNHKKVKMKDNRKNCEKQRRDNQIENKPQKHPVTAFANGVTCSNNVKISGNSESGTNLENYKNEKPNFEKGRSNKNSNGHKSSKNSLLSNFETSSSSNLPNETSYDTAAKIKNSQKGKRQNEDKLRIDENTKELSPNTKLTNILKNEFKNLSVEISKKGKNIEGSSKSSEGEKSKVSELEMGHPSKSKINNIWDGGNLVNRETSNSNNELTLNGFGKTFIQPPPGFAGVGGNSLTFTNSEGRSFSMNTDNIFTDCMYRYVCPPDFLSRNLELINKISKTLSNQGEAHVNEFKNASLLYRDNYITAMAYYAYCKEHILENHFNDVFLELLVLLPDVFKQQELWSIYQMDNPSILTTVPLKATVCQQCYQVLRIEDLTPHVLSH